MIASVWTTSLKYTTIIITKPSHIIPRTTGAAACLNTYHLQSHKMMSSTILNKLTFPCPPIPLACPYIMHHIANTNKQWTSSNYTTFNFTPTNLEECLVFKQFVPQIESNRCGARDFLLSSRATHQFGYNFMVLRSRC